MKQHDRNSEPSICVPIRVLLMLNITGYLANFWLYVQDGMTHEEAYYCCEAELEKYNLPAAYTSYESFRVAKSRHMAKDSGPSIRFV